MDLTMVTWTRPKAAHRIKEWHTNWRLGEWSGDDTPNDMLAEWANCRRAHVSVAGGLWVAEPQDGHWLDDRAAGAFVEWLEIRGAINGRFA